MEQDHAVKRVRLGRTAREDGLIHELADLNVRYEDCDCEACRARGQKVLGDRKNHIETPGLHDLLDLNLALGGI